jgi:hypothetical protein
VIITQEKEIQQEEEEKEKEEKTSKGDTPKVDMLENNQNTTRNLSMLLMVKAAMR